MYRMVGYFPMSIVLTRRSTSIAVPALVMMVSGCTPSDSGHNPMYAIGHALRVDRYDLIDEVLIYAYRPVWVCKT